MSLSTRTACPDQERVDGPQTIRGSRQAERPGAGVSSSCRPAHRHTVCDTLIFCRFYRDLIGWEDVSTIIHGLTGLEMDKAGLQALSVRIANLIRAYNLPEGMASSDDTLPPRLLEEPLEPGGASLGEEELEKMVEEYRGLRGW